MNKVILIGRLSADPELKVTPNDNKVVNFSIAVQRPYVKDKTPEVDWLNCVAWNHTAEFIAKYFQKGSRICIEDGSIRTRTYEDPNSGQKRYITEIDVRTVSFIDFKNNSTETTQNTETANSYTPPTNNTTVATKDVDEEDNDLPF